ncbi:hypothetical protein [Actinoplanes ianthinogenes]|nr:hypothetical protein [Actinoplanes ianthinogenes]
MDEHAWQTRSTHATSEGLVRYQSCACCGRWRLVVDRVRTTTAIRVPTS